jgi:hypothetical protein
MSALPADVNKPLPSAISAKLPVIEDGEYSILFDTAKFEQAYRVARLFSASQFVPEAYQGKPENCFVALQMATRLRIDPMMFMQKTYIVHGKPGMEATLVIALINARGPFTGPIQWRMDGADMDRVCTAYATHRTSGEMCEAQCSMTMAKAEGWMDKPGSKWKTLPDLMLRYRSAAFLGRLYAPECLMGIMTVDELDDVTQTGEIDVTPRVSPATRSAGALLKEVATRSAPPAERGVISDEFVNRGTGEVVPPMDVTSTAPTIDDVLAMVAAGDVDTAQDLARSLGDEDSARVFNAIQQRKAKAKK